MRMLEKKSSLEGGAGPAGSVQVSSFCVSVGVDIVFRASRMVVDKKWQINVESWVDSCERY